jgi:hypothetical protein
MKIKDIDAKTIPKYRKNNISFVGIVLFTNFLSINRCSENNRTKNN